MEAYQRYLKNTGAMRRMPPAALAQWSAQSSTSDWQDGLPGTARTQPKTADPAGAPRAIRTHDHWIRSPVLYPAELGARVNSKYLKELVNRGGNLPGNRDEVKG
jgi:hypothetical protein